MSFNLRIFLIIVLLVGFFLIIRTVKNKKLSIKYGMYWTLILIILLLLIIFPNVIESIAKLCGFKEAPNMLFFLAICILFYLVFRMNATISKLQDEVKTLIQEISIMKKK